MEIRYGPYFRRVILSQPAIFSPDFLIALDFLDSKPFYCSDENNLLNWRPVWIEQFYVDIIADDRNDYLNKRNKLCKDEPVLDPLDVGGLGQPGHNADEQGGRGQHHRQVHSDCRVEEVG